MENEQENTYNEILSTIDVSELDVGISIIGERKDNILNFVNANTKGNYQLNGNTLVISTIENSKNTMLDDEINKIIENNQKIVITLGNLEIAENENPVVTAIKEDTLIIIIDTNYFNTNVEGNGTENEEGSLYNPALVDSISKAFYDNGISTLSFVVGDNDILGQSLAFQDVYAGPSSSIYAIIGSINYLESVVMLGESFGWYHIRYSVNNGANEKFGYIPKDNINVLGSDSFDEEDFYGGICYAKNALEIRSSQNFGNSVSDFGAVAQYEGMTLLYAYNSDSGAIAFVEYSTSAGTKRGYVYQSEITQPLSGQTCVASANQELTVYSGTNTSTYQNLGTIFATELMSILAKNDNWIYVEYNTPVGRKRGYVSYSGVSPFNRPAVFPDLYTYNNSGTEKYLNGSETVYGGPNTTYASIGSVSNEPVIDFDTEGATNEQLTYIEYYITGTNIKKSGYISTSNITVIDQSAQPDEKHLTTITQTYNKFSTREVYGQTQLGRNMYYYKAGSGAKHLFLIFAHHGWEDGQKMDDTYFAGDGDALIRIAKNFIERFENTNSTTTDSILSNWTIYVFPGINLDGIVEGIGVGYGQTNLGDNGAFGRCLYNNLDPNRNWAGGFVVNNSTRNKTGSVPFQAIELQNLRDCLREERSTSGKNVLLDIHGWLNQTVGSYNSLAPYFWNHMGISQSNSNNNLGSGYLIHWANNAPDLSANENASNQPGIGADSCLVELISTRDYSISKIENDYGLKFYNAIMDLLQNYN